MGEYAYSAHLRYVLLHIFSVQGIAAGSPQWACICTTSGVPFENRRFFEPIYLDRLTTEMNFHRRTQTVPLVLPQSHCCHFHTASAAGCDGLGVTEQAVAVAAAVISESPFELELSRLWKKLCDTSCRGVGICEALMVADENVSSACTW